MKLRPTGQNANREWDLQENIVSAQESKFNQGFVMYFFFLHFVVK